MATLRGVRVSEPDGLRMMNRMKVGLVGGLAAVGLPGPLAAQGVIQTFSGMADSTGAAVGFAGDLDSDGFDDLLVGAPGDDTSAVDAGAVRARAGFDATTLFVIFGQGAGSALGSAIATIGDVDADGSLDFAVGAPGGSGRVFVVSSATGSILRDVTGTPGSAFGAALASAGDVDLDGKSDFLVGGPGVAGSVGAAYLFLAATSSAATTYLGGPPGGVFGYSLASPGDVDGDGTSDVAIGAPLDGQGVVRVYSGASTNVIRTFVGTCPDCLTDPNIRALFGQSIAAIGDIDQDGFADLAVGSVVDGLLSESWSSSAILFSGNTSAELLRLDGGGPELTGFVAQLGAIRIGDRVGDLDGDGRPDLPVTSSGVLRWGGSKIARAYSLPSGNPIFFASSAVAGFGESCSAAGDVNGDAIADVFVGSPGESRALALSSECHGSTPYGAGCSGSLPSVPSMSLSGCFVPGGSAALRLHDAAGATTLLAFVGGSAASVPLPGSCALLVAPPFAAFSLAIPPSGSLIQPLEIPIAAGLTSFHLQGFVVGGTVSTFAATRGIAVMIQ
jgi:hypothetical protein